MTGLSRDDGFPLAVLSERDEVVRRAVELGAEAGLSARLYPFRAAAAAEPGLALVDLAAGPRAEVALAALRAGGRHHVLVLAGGGDEEPIRRALALGADDFLVDADLDRYLRLRLAAGLAAHRAREEIAQRERDLTTLVALTRSFAASLDPVALLSQITGRLASALSLSRCSFVLVEEGASAGTVVAASDGQAPPNNRIVLARYPEILEAMRTQMPVVIEDAGSHPLLDPVKEQISGVGLSALAVLPLQCEANVFGVLFLRAAPGHRGFTAHEIGFASAVANATAVALRNARSMAALQRTNEFLERLIDSSVDAIVAADRRGRVLLMNKSAEALFGTTAPEAVGRLRVTDLYPDGGALEVMRMLRSEGFGGRDVVGPHRREVKTVSGERIPVQMTGAVIRDGEKELATVGIFTDLRERLKTEERLVVTQERLEKSERQAMIAELAGTAAHELNQPLTSVMGYAELMRRKLKPEDPLFRPVDIIVREAERMAEIVRKIGKITRYETKHYVGRARIVDLERASGDDR